MEQNNEEEFKEDSLKTCILFGIGGGVATLLFIGSVIFVLHHTARILGGG